MEKNELEDRVKTLELKIKELENLPYRCEVCGKPTDGYIRFLFWTHYYCKDHYPYHII